MKGETKMRDLTLTARGYLLIALVLVVSLAFSSSAQALSIKIWDHIHPALVIDDNGLEDDSALSGGIAYSGSLGIFNFIVAGGVSKPEIGSKTLPNMDLSLQVKSTATGSLQIELSDPNFGPLATGYGLHNQIGGTTWGSLTFKTYFDISNTLFAHTTEIASLGPFTGPFSGDKASSVVPGPNEYPYSLTLTADIITPANKTTSFDAEVYPTPEPGTILLLGLGLLGLGVFGRKKMGA